MNPRRLLTAAGLVLAAVSLAAEARQLLADPAVWPPDDFVEYWAAARLVLAGQNPYDPALLLPLQVAAGRDTADAVMMWNPPWALAAVLPLGLLPAREAQLLWLAVNLAAVVYCGDRLWLRFGGSVARRWVGWLIALGWVPTLFALQSGQVGPLLLLGAVLFLECERRGWYALAGAATVLLAIKPHLAYLVWLAILFDPDARRRWRPLAGGLLAGVAATLVPVAFDPRLISEYADALGNRPPAQWVSPTLGTVLRLVFGEHLFRLQFVPVLAGLGWFAWHRRRADRAWDWADQLPPLLLVSFVTAPYGAWPFDLVLLLPAVFTVLAGGGREPPGGVTDQGAHAPRPPAALALVAVNLACLLMNLFEAGSFAFLWVAPALLLLYALRFTPSPLHPFTPSAPSPAAVAFALIFAVLLLGGRSSFFRDPGTFWHVATGDRVLADGFLRADPYTFTFAGTWWVPYQWLGEVGMAVAHRAGGFDLLLVGAVAIVAGVFGWLAGRLAATGLHPVAVAATVGLALAAAAAHFHVRPHLATLAGMAVTMAVLVDVDVGRLSLRRLGWLVPLCGVWANAHGGVLGGIASVGLVAGGWVVAWRVGRPSPVRRWADAGWVLAVAAACGLVTLLNPYGLDLHRTWHRIMTAGELKAIIREHAPLDPAAPDAWPVFALAAVYLGTLAGVPLRAVRVSWLLPLVWFALGAERVRHAPLFAVTALVGLAAAWPHTRWAAWLAAHRPDFYVPAPPRPRRVWAHLLLPAVVLAVAVPLTLRTGWARHDPRDWPDGLHDVVKAHEPGPGEPNRLFNDYADGGWVIYHAPGYKVFVDDRCEVFGGPWLAEFVRASADDTGGAFPAWEREYGRLDFALTRAGSGFDRYFRGSPDWEELKRTDTAAFYRRRSPVP